MTGFPSRRGICLVAALSLLGGSGAAQGKARIKRLDGSTISGSAASVIAKKALSVAHVTGAQVAVLNRGKVVWTEAFGLRDVGAKLPMTVDTVMWAASITKGLFGAYVMTLVDSGTIDLDVPVWRYLGKPLPQVAKYKDLAGDVDGERSRHGIFYRTPPVWRTLRSWNRTGR